VAVDVEHLLYSKWDVAGAVTGTGDAVNRLPTLPAAIPICAVAIGMQRAIRRRLGMW
jgi:hypothetical protein